MLVHVVLVAFLAIASAARCPSGGNIFARGINENGKRVVINAHNGYRLQIANGQVPNQPRGINLKRMIYDKVLGEKGRIVSNTCTMNHILAKDDRWGWVGQNLYIEWNSWMDNSQNWDKVVASWFNENKDFVYPTRSAAGKMTDHYTQVVWADSKFVGCDFIHFYDVNKPKFPYAKLYTCNYGPGGNYNGQAPYKSGSSGCENLC